MRTLAFLLALSAARLAPAGVPEFAVEQVDAHVGEVCYALATADVDGDGKPDVVAATEDAIVWYANPTWRKGTILRGATRPDNVCLAAADLDRDGRADFVVGEGWGPLGLRGTEGLTWVAREPGSDAWKVRPVEAVPSLHRARVGDVLGLGRPQVVAVPLQGRGVREDHWGEGPGVRIELFRVPEKPATDPWPREVIDEGLHTTHGAQAVDLDGDGRDELLVAAWEGVFVIRNDGQGHTDGRGRWSRRKIGAGFQGDGPIRGASEVRLGRFAGGKPFVATVEPWHGREVVLYRPKPGATEGDLWDRTVIDPDADGGHGLACVDLDGDGGDEIIVAQRDPNHDLATPPDGSQILVYASDPKSDRSRFDRSIIDRGIAAEDVVAADLDGDGRVDLVAGGRETHNVRVYRNRGPALR